MPLPTAPVRLRLTATVTSPIALPSFAGSALRGAFGHSLRALACTTRAADCGGCPLANTCPYPAVFAPRHIPTCAEIGTPLDTAQLQTRDDSPPYVIEPYACSVQTSTPALALPRNLVEDDALVFHIVVWGAAHDHLAIILMAWQRALARGLGLRLLAPASNDSDGEDHHPERLPLGTASLSALHAITPAGQALPLWCAEEGQLNQAPLTQAQYALPPCPDWLAQGCMIRLISPLRVQQQGSVLAATALTAQALLAAMHRRCQNAGLAVQVPNIKQAASAITMTKHLRWRDASRFSATQQQATPLGGLVGNIVLNGDLRPFWPILHAAQWLHIGKETVFGLGALTLLPLFAGNQQANDIIANNILENNASIDSIDSIAN